MSRTGAWLIKSLLIGLAAGLASFAMSYGFLAVHQEVGIAPVISYRLAFLVFALVAVGALIYFRMKAEP